MLSSFSVGYVYAKRNELNDKGIERSAPSWPSLGDVGIWIESHLWHVVEKNTTSRPIGPILHSAVASDRILGWISQHEALGLSDRALYISLVEQKQTL